MDGLLESLNHTVRIQAPDVTVKVIAICPATIASRPGLGDTKPDQTVWPDAKTNAESKNRSEIHVEPLSGILDGSATLQITVIPDRLATMFDCTCDLPQQWGLEGRCCGRVHWSTHAETPNIRFDRNFAVKYYSIFFNGVRACQATL